MSLSNRSFRDNRTGEVIKVIDSFENIAILENKTKIDTRRLLDTNFFTEEIDPGKFLDTTPAYSSIFEEIKKLPTNNIPDDRGEIKPTVTMDSRYVPPVEDDSAVIYSSIDDEKEELARKYGVNPNTSDAISRQNEAFTRILGEESPEAAEIPAAPAAAAYQRPRVEEDPIQRIEVDRESRDVQVSDSQPKIDPIVTMFKGVKRSVEFSLDLKLENKIPRLDFIEMMEDSYERSIIDYLAQEFTDELLKNPASLRDTIANKIREMVYEKPKAPAKKAPVKRTPKPNVAAGEKPGYKKPAPKRKPATKKETEQQ